MIDKYAALLKNFLYVPLPDEYQKELDDDINKINITRGKYISSLFIFIEAVILTVLFIINRENMFKGKSFYYVHMYFLMIITMIIFLLIFIKLEKNISKHNKSIKITGIFCKFHIMLVRRNFSAGPDVKRSDHCIYYRHYFGGRSTCFKAFHFTSNIHLCTNSIHLFDTLF